MVGTPLELIPFVQQGEQLIGAKGGKWLVLLGAAKGCSTAPQICPVFLQTSRLFSFTSYLGTLQVFEQTIVCKDAAKFLRKKCFGGHLVAVALADDDFTQVRSRVHHCLEDGTVSFLGIAALRHGFRFLDQRKISAINRHTGFWLRA